MIIFNTTTTVVELNEVKEMPRRLTVTRNNLRPAPVRTIHSLGDGQHARKSTVMWQTGRAHWANEIT